MIQWRPHQRLIPFSTPATITNPVRTVITLLYLYEPTVHLPFRHSAPRMSPLSEMEAKHYYAGLPSAPPLVARTSTTPWEAPTGPETHLPRKELRPVGEHALAGVWGDGLGRKVSDLLTSRKVDWTSVDLVRIGVEDEYFAPVILWIGVTPGSLSHDDGSVVAHKCKELLEERGIADVDVEIRGSVIIR